MTKPIWLLDVDGVLNANNPGWGEAPKTGTAYANGFPYKIRWAPRLVDQIVRLHESGRVEIRWSSTWCEMIGEIENLLGLPHLYCEDIPCQGMTQQAKIDAAVRVVNSKIPLIWTDDDAIPEKGAAGWDSRFNHPYGGKLFIAPNESHGLQFSDIQEIDAFLKECESR